jgi:hypothetical protein
MACAIRKEAAMGSRASHGGAPGGESAAEKADDGDVRAPADIRDFQQAAAAGQAALQAARATDAATGVQDGQPMVPSSLLSPLLAQCAEDCGERDNVYRTLVHRDRVYLAPKLIWLVAGVFLGIIFLRYFEHVDAWSITAICGGLATVLRILLPKPTDPAARRMMVLSLMMREFRLLRSLRKMKKGKKDAKETKPPSLKAAL